MAPQRAAPAFLPALALSARRHAAPAALTQRRPAARGARAARAPRRVARASVVEPGTVPPAQLVEQFAAAVRGEWVGYEATFDGTTGAVEAIPDYYIPEQFQEWGLTPVGFETNHSVIVRGDTLYRKFFRVLPTVSHFADHVDTEEDLVQLALVGPDAAAIFADGSFIAGPARVAPVRKSKLDKWPALSFCLRDPRADARRAANVWLRFDFERRAFAAPVRVGLEKWSCDHCDGADLEGSSGFVDGWPSGAGGDAARLAGEWTVRRELGGDAGRAPDDVVLLRGDEDDASAAVYLPEGVDVAVADAPDGGVVVRAGWLVDDDTRVVLARSFAPDGAVVKSEHSTERRVS